jgi:hypothetical protein
MTNEKILELAKTCGFDDFTGEKENFWECWEEQLIAFADQIYLTGWREGYEVCLKKLNPSIEDLIQSTKSCEEQ